MGKLVAFAPDATDEVLAYLRPRPYDNVYASWLIATGQIGPESVVLWRKRGGTLDGVAYISTRMIPFSESADALDAFANMAARVVRSPRMIVGCKPMIARFWSTLHPQFHFPFRVRERQPVYAIDRASLLVGRDAAEVARSQPEEVDEIAEHSALMTSGEIDSPIAADVAYRKRTLNLIEAGWSWRLRVGGRLAFLCNVGSATPQTAQINGVWTPPGMRGHGYATRALGAICDHLLDEHPTLSLYVNDFNRDAIALYDRVGFTRVGEFATILF